MSGEKIIPRFTDRARLVMRLANEDAIRFNCECVDTEHILLGLVKENSGVAVHTLIDLNIDLSAIRLEVGRLMPMAPDAIIVGKRPQSHSARNVIEYAAEEVRHLQHHYLGTEHLLLGLIREQNGAAARILVNLGLTVDGIREGVQKVLGYDGIPDIP